MIKIIAIALVLAAGCGKDKDKAGEGGGGAATPSGPLEMTAAELWTDYNRLEGVALLNKYRGGVTVTGTVKTVGDMGGEALTVWIDVDGSKWITLDFVDKGAAMRAKGVKAGDTVTATCKVGGATDNYMMLLDCTP
jgi:hypothetical protein